MDMLAGCVVAAILSRQAGNGIADVHQFNRERLFGVPENVA